MYEDFFYERLVLLRTQKGVSARDMSIRLGAGAGYINNIENKRNLPSMSMFFCICEYLNVTPVQFFDPNVKNPDKLNELIVKLERFNSQQLEAMATMADAIDKNK